MELKKTSHSSKFLSILDLVSAAISASAAYAVYWLTGFGYSLPPLWQDELFPYIVVLSILSIFLIYLAIPTWKNIKWAKTVSKIFVSLILIITIILLVM